MDLIILDNLPDQQSMLTFHALARMGFEGLILVSPKDPLVSIGYFQDTEKEIDVENCRKLNIPYMRREVGGGATYLDKNQIFYQIIWNKNNIKFPSKIAEIVEFLSQAPISTYDDFGIKTQFKRENDIITLNGKKIAGEAGGDIANSMVFVGGILMDFDYQIMPQVLKVPDEKFRDKIYKTLEENLTTIKKETGFIPNRNDVISSLIKSFEKLLGSLNPVQMPDEAYNLMSDLKTKFTSDEFIYKKTPRKTDGVKIREGVNVLYGIHKSRGGLIRSYQDVKRDTFENVDFSGDFQMFPRNSLEILGSALSDVKREERYIDEKLNEIIISNEIQSPGVSSDDLVQSIFNTK